MNLTDLKTNNEVEYRTCKDDRLKSTPVPGFQKQATAVKLRNNDTVMSLDLVIFGTQHWFQ